MERGEQRGAPPLPRTRTGPCLFSGWLINDLEEGMNSGVTTPVENTTFCEHKGHNSWRLRKGIPKTGNWRQYIYIYESKYRTKRQFQICRDTRTRCTKSGDSQPGELQLLSLVWC